MDRTRRAATAAHVDAAVMTPKAIQQAIEDGNNAVLAEQAAAQA